MNTLPSGAWRKLLVLAVHPDDESLAAGGLIQQALARGADVRVVFVTDGDNNPWPQRFLERRWRIGAAERTRWGRRRRAEAITALGVLGVGEANISFWHYPDQGITDLLGAGGEGLIARLATEFIASRPTLLVAPAARDRHPDHSALAVLVELALRRASGKLPDVFTRLDYVVHPRSPRFTEESFQLTLTPKQVVQKRRAILEHRTQMALSRRRFLGYARPVETFLRPASWRPSPALVDEERAPARVCAVIPCYNVGEVCGAVIRSATQFADRVIVVDDGSTDRTPRVLADAAARFPEKVDVITFPANRGKGAGLLAAFRHAAGAGGFDVLVTLDGDGQHRPQDIPRLAQPITENGRDFVVGERSRAGMPPRSRFGNALTAGLLKIFYTSAPTDTQSGFRAFHRDFVQEIIRSVRGGRYETELEILLLALRRKRRLGFVEIPTIYLERNRLSHFRPLADSLRIYWTLLRSRFQGGASR